MFQGEPNYRQVGLVFYTVRDKMLDWQKLCLCSVSPNCLCCRLMEEGRWDEANKEKIRIEEKQRTVRRQREAEAEKAASEGTHLISYFIPISYCWQIIFVYRSAFYSLQTFMV